MMRIILSVLIIFFLFACSSNNKKFNNSDFININLENTKQFKRPYLLSSLAKEVEYIKLETTNDCQIERIGNVKFFENHIYIQDRDAKLYKFNKDGSFEKTIGRQGRGPGEYLSIKDFTILESGRKILILDDFGRKIIEYNLDGLYLKHKTINFYPSSFETTTNDQMVFNNIRPRYSASNNFTLSVLGTDYKFRYQLLDRSNEIKPNDSRKVPAVGMFSLNKYDDHIAYWEYHYDTLWHIVGNNVQAKYFFNYGKYRMPDEVREANVNDVASFAMSTDIVETKNNIFITSCYLNRLKHFLYRKKENDVIDVEFKGSASYMNNIKISNDIDGGISFWPDDKSGFINDTTLLHSFYAFQFKKDFEKDNNIILHEDTLIKKRVSFEKVVEESSLLDNPILMIIHLK